MIEHVCTYMDRTGYRWILGFGNGSGSYYSVIMDLGFRVWTLGVLGFKAYHVDFQGRVFGVEVGPGSGMDKKMGAGIRPKRP